MGLLICNFSLWAKNKGLLNCYPIFTKHTIFFSLFSLFFFWRYFSLCLLQHTKNFLNYMDTENFHFYIFKFFYKKKKLLIILFCVCIKRDKNFQYLPQGKNKTLLWCLGKFYVEFSCSHFFKKFKSHELLCGLCVYILYRYIVLEKYQESVKEFILWFCKKVNWLFLF